MVIVRLKCHLFLAEFVFEFFVKSVCLIILTENLRYKRISKKVSIKRMLFKNTYRHCSYTEWGVVIFLYKRSSFFGNASYTAEAFSVLRPIVRRVVSKLEHIT